jgi:hypothetical protein
VAGRESREQPPAQPQSSTPVGAAWSKDTAPATARPPKATSSALPFYQLYLLQSESPPPPSGGEQAPLEEKVDASGVATEAAGGHRGEYVLELRHAGASACATVLEMLYVPAGRSGSAAECYLLYEDYAEFAAAAGFVANLDVPALADVTAGVGARAAFDSGVAKYLRIIDAGAIVDPALVDGAERGLAEAAQSSGLTAHVRWAAAILAGRLVSDYRYDYSAARSYYRQAERVAGTNSLENMTARWWQADAFLQEGRTGDADEIYKGLLAEYEQQWKDAHIVHRCRAALQPRRK